MAPRMRLTVSLSLFACAVALAQEPPSPAAPAADAVRVVVVRGSGDLGEDAEAQIPADLEPWSRQLRRLELAEYQLLGQSEQKATDPARPLRFDLPVGMHLEARPPGSDAAPLSPEELAGKVRLVLHVTRPDPDAPAGEPRDETVVETEVLLAPGQYCLLRCTGVLPEGDLLLLVCAGPRG